MSTTSDTDVACVPSSTSLEYVVNQRGARDGGWRCEICAAETEPPEGAPPACCGLLMRPAAVLFGELIPPNADHAATRALRDCDLFVAIGTSGTVFPASGFVRWAAYNGARRILLNLEIDDEARDAYSECHTGTADELVPRLFG